MEKRKPIITVLFVILSVFIIAEILIGINMFGQMVSLDGVLYVLGLIAVLAYVLVLYKKPHGNLLKYAFLIFALSLFITCANMLSMSDNIRPLWILQLVAAGAICYCAGRLHRIRQNCWILAVCWIVLFVLAITNLIKPSINIPAGTISVIPILVSLSPVIALTTLMLSYFVRYKEHKEAGLMDASEE